MPSVVLIDVNNFFVSCERAMDPKLRHVPLVVLSNNDGVIIARSNEVKKMKDFPDWSPWFKVKEQAKRQGIHWLSSNYELYSDISDRMKILLENHSPRVENYSIDEAFVEIPLEGAQAYQWAQDLQYKISHHLCLPVGIGVGRTKTEAKIASEIAKHNPPANGVVSLDTINPSILEKIMARVPVKEIWGIGSQTSKKLKKAEIDTIQDFKNADPGWIHKKFSLSIWQTYQELQGVQQFELETELSTPKSLVYSRSFSQKITNSQTVEYIGSLYGQLAAERLRKKGLQAGTLKCWLSTGPRANDVHTALGTTHFLIPTHDPAQIAQHTSQIFLDNVRPHHRYAKAGIEFTNLSSGVAPMLPLFAEKETKGTINEAVTEVREKLQGTKIGYGIGGLAQSPEWFMRQNKISPRSTTFLEDVPTINLHL